jgi:CheY-like chemotaxis protein
MSEKRLLVVDDEPAVATIMQRLLNHLGYTVEAFTDSARALEAYTKEPEAFDLVITDMTMPKLTGLAIARAMLALRPQQPIILYTGFSEAVDEEIASAEGIKALLAKPISQETLAHTVRRTLDLDKAQVSPAA